MKLLRVPEVSERTGLPHATIRKMIFLEKLPVVRIGRTVAIPEDAIDKLIEENFHPAKE
ncbi:MAG: helix-turn-helix domain-containing protein [Candidatus Manganitrophaceae bacterium]